METNKNKRYEITLTTLDSITCGNKTELSSSIRNLQNTTIVRFKHNNHTFPHSTFYKQ